MRLWFDEDLSPSLVQVANELGLEATCNRDRSMLACQDSELRRVVQEEGYVFVTNNASDFRSMYSRDDIHPGLVLMPGDQGLDTQKHHVREVLRYITTAANKAEEPSCDFMINKVAEITSNGECDVRNLHSR